MLELKWRKGPAQGDATEVYCGDRFLAAIPVRSTHGGLVRKLWDYAVVEITEDGCEVESCSWGWDWSDVEWYVPVGELTPGPLPAFADEKGGVPSA